MKNEAVSRAVRLVKDIMYAEREELGFSRKLEACAYMKHRMDSTTKLVRGDIVVHDDVAIGYLDDVCNGMMAAVMNQSDYWFKFTLWGSGRRKQRIEKKRAVAKSESLFQSSERQRLKNGSFISIDEVDGALDFFEDASQNILSEFHNSDYYSDKQASLLDGLIMGYGLLSITENVAEGRIEYKCLDPLQCCVDVDSNGDIVRFCRTMTMSATEMFFQFGLDSLPEEVSKAIRDGRRDTYELVEYIGKRGCLFDPNTLEPIHCFGGKAYDHIVMILSGEGADSCIQVNGFDCMPITLFNSRKASKGGYGVGIVERYLEDVKKLDDFERRRHAIIQYIENPAWAIPMSMQGKMNIAPGAKNNVPTVNDVPVPLQKLAGSSYDAILQSVADQREKVKNLFNVYVFETILGSGDSRKTATEVGMRKTEASQKLSSLLGNLQRTVSKEVVRTFNILRSNNIIVVPTRDIDGLLRNHLLRVELDSVFIQKMKSFYMVEGNMSLTNMLQLLYSIDPTIGDVIDIPELARLLSLGLGASQHAIFEKSETEQKTKKREEAQQQMMEAQINNQNSDSLNKLSSASRMATGAEGGMAG